MGSMKLGSIALLTGAVMLAGCNKKPDDVSLKDASVEKVANTAQNAVKLQPGQWEMSFAIDKMEIPGMPAGARAHQRTGPCIRTRIDDESPSQIEVDPSTRAVGELSSTRWATAVLVLPR